MINDIIELKKKHNLIEEDATDEKQKQWYRFAIRNSLVITEYNNDKLLGFVEYVHLKKLPKNTDDFYKYATDFIHGHVILIGNVISDCPKTMWSLYRKFYKKNGNFSHLCWHRKKTGLLSIHRRSQYA